MGSVMNGSIPTFSEKKDLAVAYHKCFKKDAILPFMPEPIEFISVGYKIPDKSV